MANVEEVLLEGNDGDDIESKIKSAMHLRISHFSKLSDSLKFEGVLRVLEEDLGLPEFSLDSHRPFVKQLLVEFLNQNAYFMPKEIEKEETAVIPDFEEQTINIKEHNVEGDKMEDSPVMGLLQQESMVETVENIDKESALPNEEDVKKALWKRASYIKANAESITMAGLRRLLEEDLKVEKFSLDPFKKFLSHQLDEILKSSEESEPKCDRKRNSNGKAASGKNQRIENSDEDLEEEEGSDEAVDEEEYSKRKPTKKEANFQQSRKRKNTEKEVNASKKRANARSEKKGNNIEDGSNDSDSKTSSDKPRKKKEVSSAPTPSYGKRVEHLKSVIKSCSISVPPSVYKKVKQVAESQREAHLIKELEDILAKEGLSSDPSEKEIKEVKRRKERAKELEGIDTSNIVSSSRRRSAAYTPKPQAPSESEEEEDDGDVDDHDDVNDEKIDDDVNEDNESGCEEEEEDEEEEAASDEEDEESE